MNKEEIIEFWERQRLALLGGRCAPAERTLWDVLGMLIYTKRDFEFFLSCVSQGSGFCLDGGGVHLPASVVERAFEDGVGEKDFVVEVVWNGFGDPDEIHRLSMPKFTFCASVAIVFHSSHVDRDLNPWEHIERIRVACSPRSQFNKVSEEIRGEIGLEWRHWSRYE